MNADALNAKSRGGFELVKVSKDGHACSMKITDDVREYAAEQAIDEEEALKKSMEAKSDKFVEKGAEVYAKSESVREIH